ncbi:MAG TPA: hypothetical protein VMU94_18600 [Streptosporangiaceae bacterium]|nr:hypothetical protein [Streptosporangiaceae bacterium]
MSEMERHLRVLMNVAAGEPPNRVNAEIVRRRAARRRLTAALASAAAVALVGGLGAVVSARATGLGLGSSPAGGSGLPAGVPRYYVESGFPAQGHQSTVVRATATGAVTATIRSPWQGGG